jgi:S1-C subfamily serine protease
MGNGFGLPFRLSSVALAGLSSLVVSCSGVQQPRQPTALQRTEEVAAATRAVAAVPAGAPAAALGGPADLKVPDEFDAPHLQTQFEAVAKRAARCVVAISAIDFPVKDDAVQHPDQTNPEKLNAALAAFDRTVGTGFVVDAAAGLVVTNEHVVGKARQIWVTTDERKVYPAVVVGSDPRSDLAVLKIPATHLPAARFAAGEAHRGQWTLAIGNPYGLAGDGEMAVSVGIVSAVGRSLPKLSGKEDRLYQDLIQTTAQINPGNSGGPLFDIRGDVVGINCAVILPVKQVNGIGFALPMSDRVRSVIDRLKTGKEVTYAYLGVRTSTPTDQEYRDAGVRDAAGARVDHVEPGSPADAGGLKVGDVIRTVGGSAVGDTEQFVRVVGDQPLGSPVPVRVQRLGKSASVSVTLKARELAAAPVTRDNQRFTWRGLLLGSRSAAEAGVVVLGVEAGSPLADTVKQGDVVEALGGFALGALPDFIEALAQVPMEKCAVKLKSRGTEAKGAVVSARD